MTELKFYNADGSLQFTLAMPGSWQELTQQQFIDVAHAIYTYPDADERHAHICIALLGKSDTNRIPVESIIKDVFPLLDWVYKQPEITKQLQQVIWAGVYRYFGPESDFNNLTIIEYDFADRELYQWLRSLEAPATRNDEHLWRFMACLYRRPKKFYNRRLDRDGDIREKFNENKLKYFAGELADDVHIGKAYATILWYKACRDQITKLYPAVFSGDGDSSATGFNELPNHFNLMRKIAEKGTYGNMQEVEKMYLHTVMLELEKSILEYEEAKRANK